MKHLISFIKSIPRALVGFIALIVFTVLATLAVQSPPVSALVDTPWGPDRATFTWANPAPYATFNSITDNPAIGDERNFVRIREVADDTLFGDEVTLEPGKTYEVYIYYHNNADANNVGQTALGIADGVGVQSSFPATVYAGERATVTATITASDTLPLSVWDGAYMHPTQDLYLRYVPGTATIHNGGALDGANIGPDYLFGNGALLGYNRFSGLLPGCNDYAGYITYQIFADYPDFTFEKSIVGGSSVVDPGSEVTFKLRYENIGTMDQTNVVLQDIMPDALAYIPGSAILYNNNFPNGRAVNDDLVTEHGMSIGDYAGGSGWAELVYRAVVNKTVNCGTTIVNSATVSTNDGNKHDGAELIVSSDSCGEPEEVVEEQEPTPEDCAINPSLPECASQEPDPETCATNSNLPGCQAPTAEPETCATNPNLPGCQELPSTGPLEITLAIVVLLGISGGGFYLWRTRRTLKTVEDNISGKGTSGPGTQTPPSTPSSAPSA